MKEPNIIIEHSVEMKVIYVRFRGTYVEFRKQSNKMFKALFEFAGKHNLITEGVTKVLTIATTRLMPLHAGKGKSIARSIRDILDYGKNPEKTDGGRLVSCYECDPTETNDQFLMKKQIYEQITQRKETNNERNVIAYQIRQSFAPEDNITAERANELGMELARNFTHSGTRAGNDFQIVVCTHIDTLKTGGVIHNHIYFNSTSLDCSRKFDNEFNTAEKVQVLSDELCRENGLFVIEEEHKTASAVAVKLEVSANK